MDNKSKISWWQPGLVIFTEVTGLIAGPIIIALFLGRYLDEKNNSEPWYFLGLTGLAIIISSIGIVHIASKYIKRIEEEKNNKINKEKDLTKHQ